LVRVKDACAFMLVLNEKNARFDGAKPLNKTDRLAEVGQSRTRFQNYKQRGREEGFAKPKRFKNKNILREEGQSRINRKLWKLYYTGSGFLIYVEMGLNGVRPHTDETLPSQRSKTRTTSTINNNKKHLPVPPPIVWRLGMRLT
jgi:hypothetical protein